MKQTILEQIEILKDRVEREDVQGLIDMIDEMRFVKDNRCSIYGYIRTLVIEFISEYMKFKNIDTIKIDRKSVYGGKTSDTYRIKEGDLYRNGHTTKFDSVGKLYKAYKHIIEIEAKNKKQSV